MTFLIKSSVAQSLRLELAVRLQALESINTTRSPREHGSVASSFNAQPQAPASCDLRELVKDSRPSPAAGR